MRKKKLRKKKLRKNDPIYKVRRIDAIPPSWMWQVYSRLDVLYSQMCPTEKAARQRAKAMNLLIHG